MAIAVAFIAWDHKSHVLEDPTIGEIKFIMKAWGLGSDVKFLTELGSHFCTEEELNDIEGNNVDSIFFPVSKLSETDKNYYTGRFKCLDEPEKLVLRGNYDSDMTSNLMAVFDMCNNATSSVTCKTPEEINEFLQFKYLMSLTNTRRFVQDEFGERRMSNLSVRSWYPFDPNSRAEYVEQLTRIHVQLEDNPMGVAGIGQE